MRLKCSVGVNLLLHGRRETMRRYTTVCLLISLLGCLAQSAFAQCGDSTTPTEEQSELENRSVLLSVKLSKGGAVRDATVIRGPEALRTPAIRAAKARKYKHRIVYSFPDPHEMMVQVTFPQSSNGPPDVRQALPAGEPGCVSAGKIRVSSEVMRHLLRERVEPVYPPQTRKEGTLVFLLSVDEEGNVRDVEKISGPDTLAPAAIEAVKKWKYRPYLLNGVPVEVETTVSLNFAD
jgi:Gram-negative bacterial TonB protein C-terminal